MAKKKEEKEAKDTAFNWEETLNGMEISEALKAGFHYYLINNDIEVKSENDLTKFLKKFEEMNAGV